MQGRKWVLGQARICRGECEPVERAAFDFDDLRFTGDRQLVNRAAARMLARVRGD